MRGHGDKPCRVQIIGTALVDQACDRPVQPVGADRTTEIDRAVHEYAHAVGMRGLDDVRRESFIRRVIEALVSQAQHHRATRQQRSKGSPPAVGIGRAVRRRDRIARRQIERVENDVRRRQEPVIAQRLARHPGQLLALQAGDIALPVVDTGYVQPHRPLALAVAETDQRPGDTIAHADLFAQLTRKAVRHGFITLTFAAGKFPEAGPGRTRTTLGDQQPLTRIHQNTDRDIDRRAFRLFRIHGVSCGTRR